MRASLLAVLIALGWGISYAAGGAGGIASHFFYIPITLGAAWIGPAGGAAVGLVCAVAAGPLLPLDVAAGVPQLLTDWTSRGAYFTGLGVFAGWVFERGRALERRLRSSEHVTRILMGGLQGGGRPAPVTTPESEPIRRLLRTREGLRIALQPIVEILTRRTVGYEALSRFEGEPSRPPNEWFADAWRAGLGVELELWALRRALAQMEDLPEEVFLSVNLSPATVVSRAFAREVRGLPASRLVLETTEHAPVSDYDALVRPLSEFRLRGGRVAVDDTGAGYASLRHILKVSPDLIKLDMEICRGIGEDRVRRTLAEGLILFASRIEAPIVAEGIETDSELRALRTLGAHYGHGYLGAPQLADRTAGSAPV